MSLEIIFSEVLVQGLTGTCFFQSQWILNWKMFQEMDLFLHEILFLQSENQREKRTMDGPLFDTEWGEKLVLHQSRVVTINCQQRLRDAFNDGISL